MKKILILCHPYIKKNCVGNLEPLSDHEKCISHWPVQNRSSKSYKLGNCLFTTLEDTLEPYIGIDIL